MPTPRLSIGSSTEALPIARALHASLEHVAEVTPWDVGVFVLSHNTIDELRSRLDRSDLGAFVTCPMT